MLDRQASGNKSEGRCQEGSYERTKCGLQVLALRGAVLAQVLQELREALHVLLVVPPTHGRWARETGGVCFPLADVVLEGFEESRTFCSNRSLWLACSL